MVIVVFACLFSGLLFSGLLNEEHKEEKFEQKTDKLEILSNSGEITYYEWSSCTRINVTGKAKNVGVKVLSYASVEANFYDSSGNLLGNSHDNISDLAPNEIWNFEIVYYDRTTVNDIKYLVYVGSCW